MAPIHFKSAAQAVSAASTLSKKGSKFSTKQCSRKKCLCVLEDCTNHILQDPPQQFAATGNMDTLKEAIKTFGLTLRETDKNLSTLLHHASGANQTPVMQYLIENGAELGAADKDGNTALHLAACKGSVDAIRLLLDSGAPTAAVNSLTDAPIHTAGKEKSGQSLRAFLSHPRVDWGLKGFRNRTVLHAIAETDNLECFKVLHDEALKRTGSACQEQSAHADIGLCLCNKDDDGLTALHLAARMNSYQVLEHMIQQCKIHNADSLLGFVDEENGTPLHTAVDAGHLEVARVMLRYGADPLALRGDIPPPLHLACSQGRVEMLQAIMESCGVKVLQSLDQNGRSPLHYSAFSIHSRPVISFMANQCKEEMCINQQDSRGRTPLHMSISSGNLAGVKEFLARGADPFIKDNEGHNALHFAVLHNRKAIIMALRETPYSDDLTNETNAKGYSPVHIGLRLGLKDIVSVLISSIQLQPKNIKDPHGNNYIHLAASSGDWKALTAFLDLTNAPKLLNETNNHGATPLHYASKNGHAQCIELLLNSGAMAHKSHKGVSPLMLASREGHMECVKILHKAHPFQTDWQDDDGDTALHYAAHSCNPAMVQQILDLGGEIIHNDSGKSFLDIIVANGAEDCGLAVVNHRRWQECLDVVSPVLEHPMLSLVRRMPAIAKAVLDRCHTVECSRSETFNFKYLLTKCTNDPGQEHTPATADRPTPKRHPSVLTRGKTKQKLLQEVAIKDLEMVDADINRMTIHRRRSTFTKKQVPAPAGKKRKTSQSMEVLKRMIQHKRVDLLVHPVVSAYLKKKWNSYGRFIYLLYSGSLAMLVFSLTMFVILSPNPAHAHQPHNTTAQNSSGNPISYNMSQEELSGSNVSDNATADSNIENYFNAQAVFRYLAVISNILFAADTLAGLLVHGLQSVNFVDRILLWNSFIAIILNFVFLLAPDPFAPKVLPFGAGACFFTWMVLFGALEFFDVFGVYVNMFFKILRTVFHVLFVCFFLLMAFALAMYVVASRVTEFSSIGFSIFSVFGYMLGEVQYSLFIEKASSSEDKLQNSNVIILLITILAVMMSIVMANLLIGLAVGDIEQIKMNAVYNRRTLEVVFFTHLDHYAPKCVGRIIAPDSWTIHHDRAKHSWKKLLDYLKSMVKTEVLDIPEFQEDETDYRRSSNAPPVNIALEMSQIKQKLQDMSDLLHNMQEGSQDCRRRNLCWQKPQTSTLSIDSSNSDVSMTASDFLADFA